MGPRWVPQCKWRLGPTWAKRAPYATQLPRWDPPGQPTWIPCTRSLNGINLGLPTWVPYTRSPHGINLGLPTWVPYTRSPHGIYLGLPTWVPYTRSPHGINLGLPSWVPYTRSPLEPHGPDGSRKVAMVQMTTGAHMARKMLYQT